MRPYLGHERQCRTIPPHWSSSKRLWRNALPSSRTGVHAPIGPDLDYHMEDFEPGAGAGRDSAFYPQRTDRAVLDEALSRSPGRVLDVACGSGELAARLRASGWQAWGPGTPRPESGLG